MLMVVVVVLAMGNESANGANEIKPVLNHKLAAYTKRSSHLKACPANASR